MKILLITTCATTANPPIRLVRDGTRQIERIIPYVLRRTQDQDVLLLASTSGPAMATVAALREHIPLQDHMVEHHDFFLPDDSGGSMQSTAGYIKRQVDRGEEDVLIVIADPNHIPALPQAIMNILWGTDANLPVIHTGHVVLFDSESTDFNPIRN